MATCRITAAYMNTNPGRNEMSGHIQRRGERSWRLKFDLGRDPITGKRETRYHTFKGTKREAHAELTRLTAEALRGTYVDATPETVSGFLDRWDRDWASTHVSPKTVERYRGIIAKQIKPYIGNRPIQKLRAVDLSELYAKLLREDDLAPRTVGHVHRLLHRALGHAATWGVVQQNIASLVSPPRVASTKIEIIRENEIECSSAKTSRSINVHDRDAGVGNWHAPRRVAGLALEGCGSRWRKAARRTVS